MKKALCVLLILGVLLSLAGCHGSYVPPVVTAPPQSNQVGEKVDPVVPMNQFTAPESFDTSKSYELSFWAKNDTNKTQIAIYKEAIAGFEKLYPNIKVNLKLYNDYGRIYNDVITNISTDTTPNVCITYPDHIATYLTGTDTVVPLSGLMTNEKYGLGGSELRFDGPDQGEIVEQFLSECVIGTETYALPYMRSTEACYINKTYVERLGYTVPDVLTWDFVWEVSAAAMAKDRNGNFLVNGDSVMIPFIYKSTDNMMIQMLHQQGAGYATAAGEIEIFNDATQAILEQVAASTKLGAFSTFKLIGYPANYLNAGHCIFAIDSTAGATWMGCDAPLIDINEEELVEFETVVRPIPQYDTANPSMISQGPSVCIFEKDDPQEVVASWLFTQYLLTNSVQIAYSQTEGYVPVTTKAIDSGEYQDYLSREGEDNGLYYDVKLQASKLLLNNLDHTFVTPVFNGSTSLRKAAGDLIEETTKGVRRGKKVNDAFYEEIYTNVAALHRLDRVQSGGRKAFGPLPGVSVFLLVALGCAWTGIGGYCLWQAVKKKQGK